MSWTIRAYFLSTVIGAVRNGAAPIQTSEITLSVIESRKLEFLVVPASEQKWLGALSLDSRPNKVTYAHVALLTCLFFGLFLNRCMAEDVSEIAKAAQNPVASMISLPFQNNLNFGVGPRGDQQDVLDIQPVIPVKLTEDWNLITRTIVPVVYEPYIAPGVGNSEGLGDAQLAMYFSPAAPTKSIIWGVGPALSFPTASEHYLGQGKFSAGISAVALTGRGPWLFGLLVTDIASIAGGSDRRDVHQFLTQPFVNFNFPHGWYLTTSPIMTANWKAPSDNRWTVPIGGGGGKILRIGKQHINAYIQAFDNVVRPQEAGNWTLRVQIQLLFPK